jgi:GNAT superfamily N-acetyltransferase
MATNTAVFSIRLARKADIPDITRLNDQLGYPEPESAVALRLRRILGDRRDHRVFVAAAGASTASPSGAIVGWIHVFIDKLLTVGPRAEIGGLVVEEQWRSRGVGAALVNHAEQWAKQSGFAQIVVRTNVVRTRAHEFYEKCGYQLLKHSKVYNKELT